MAARCSTGRICCMRAASLRSRPQSANVNDVGPTPWEQTMSHLKKVDHITYACERGAIEKWAWFHIEVEGGSLINRIDEVRPEDPDSSMKNWCIDYGDFGIALVEGIDRRKKSQVTRFVERHGDHACQHVASDCHNLERFREPPL